MRTSRVYRRNSRQTTQVRWGVFWSVLIRVKLTGSTGTLLLAPARFIVFAFFFFLINAIVTGASENVFGEPDSDLLPTATGTRSGTLSDNP